MNSAVDLLQKAGKPDAGSSEKQFLEVALQNLKDCPAGSEYQDGAMKAIQSAIDALDKGEAKKVDVFIRLAIAQIQTAQVLAGDTPALPPVAAASTSTAPSTAASAPPAAGSGGGDPVKSVVIIRGDNGEGSGFLVKMPDGVAVVSNLHVVANNPNIKIVTNSGTEIKMQSAKGASDRDLVLLYVQDSGFSCLDLAPDVGENGADERRADHAG